MRWSGRGANWERRKEAYEVGRREPAGKGGKSKKKKKKKVYEDGALDCPERLNTHSFLLCSVFYFVFFLFFRLYTLFSSVLLRSLLARKREITNKTSR